MKPGKPRALDDRVLERLAKLCQSRDRVPYERAPEPATLVLGDDGVQAHCHAITYATQTQILRDPERLAYGTVFCCGA